MKTCLYNKIISILRNFLASKLLLFNKLVSQTIHLDVILFVGFTSSALSHRHWIFVKTQFRERLLWVLMPAFAETQNKRDKYSHCY